MKIFIKQYRLRRNRRYYQKLWRNLLLTFIDKDRTLFDAKNDADAAFLLLTGREYDYIKQDVSAP